MTGIEVRLSLLRERERGGAGHKSGRMHQAKIDCVSKQGQRKDRM